MRLTCPFCGNRGIEEFAYLGDGTLAAPAPAAAQADWVDYVYIRTNTAGEHLEIWYHEAGCRQFLDVRRNTLTHAILGKPTAR